jgi:hypothetical protein
VLKTRAVFALNAGGCVIGMMWKTAAEFNKTQMLNRRIFATREAAREVLLAVPKLDRVDFRIAQDGIGRASIELIVVNRL